MLTTLCFVLYLASLKIQFPPEVLSALNPGQASGAAQAVGREDEGITDSGDASAPCGCSVDPTDLDLGPSTCTPPDEPTPVSRSNAADVVLTSAASGPSDGACYWDYVWWCDAWGCRWMYRWVCFP